jgi:hypothetical protein
MRCPKCSYISFDKVTSCVKCSADVTEVAHALNGTAFKPLGTFYLGTLIPDYAATFAPEELTEDFAMDSGSDDLDISMDAIGDFGEVPDLPGDIDMGDEDFSLAGEDIPDFGGDDISLDDHDIPDMDLSSFEAEAGHEGEVAEDVGFDDVPEFDLGGVEFEEEADLEMAGDDLELEEDGAATPDFSDIDLSLGEEELEMAGEEEEMVDLADLEMETEKDKDKGQAELPDLEL